MSARETLQAAFDNEMHAVRLTRAEYEEALTAIDALAQAVDLLEGARFVGVDPHLARSWAQRRRRFVERHG